jgi:hypothetical protein
LGGEAGTAPDGFGSWELLQQQQEVELEFRSCSRDKEGRKEGRKERKAGDDIVQHNQRISWGSKRVIGKSPRS